MKCSNCGAVLRKDSLFCHKCGTRIEADVEEVIRSAEESENGESPAEEAVADTEEVKEAAKDSYENVKRDAADPLADERFDEYFKLEEEEPGKKKGFIIGAVVAAAAICLICFCCSNTFKRTFYKPADYYRYVEKKNAKETIKLATDWYDAGNLLIPGNGSVGYEDKLALRMSGDILSEAAEALDVYGVSGQEQDFSWLQDISISGQATMYGDLGSRNTAIAIGSDTVLTINTVADKAADRMYLRIPELSSSYVGFDAAKIDELSEMIEKYTDSSVSVSTGMYDYMSMSKALPEAYRINKLLNKYSDICFDNMNNVTRSGKQKLEIGGVAQKCYCLTVTFDYKDMKSLGRQLREELTEDKDVKDSYIKLMEADGKNGEESWNDLADGLYVLEDILGSTAGTEMKVYVDTCGNVIAREITPAETDITVRYGHTVNGRNFGAQLVVNADGDDIVALRGNGKKAGQSYAGDFKLAISGADPIGITLDSFDYKAFTKQKVETGVSVSVKEIADALDIRNPAVDFLDDYKAVLSVSTPSSGSYVTNIRLSDGMSDPVVMDYSYRKTGGSRITVPEDALMIEGLSDIKVYIKDADFSKVRNNLENAGVPSSITGYISYIEKAADYLDYIDLFL
ncbi:MAG: zinc ribbon domain-containing protein [Lachnospiraceae bacterium]|nr:zinc ribbon domain-containing protein [Lachnospiraceae bacterium]